MRLGGCERIGIILTVVWALGAAWYQRTADIRQAEKAFHLAYQTCRDIQDNAASRNKDFDFNKCDAKGAEAWDLSLEGSWAKAAFVSLAPIPLGWLAMYLLMVLWKWVRLGFASAPRSNQ